MTVWIETLRSFAVCDLVKYSLTSEVSVIEAVAVSIVCGSSDTISASTFVSGSSSGVACLVLFICLFCCFEFFVFVSYFISKTQQSYKGKFGKATI
jgi:hypothetical protein